MVFGYIKELVIGIVLIVLGLMQYILLIPFVGDFIADTFILNLMIPGKWIFQVLLIVLGVLVMFKRITFKTTH